jgi:hypothetical protein
MRLALTVLIWKHNQLLLGRLAGYWTQTNHLYTFGHLVHVTLFFWWHNQCSFISWDCFLRLWKFNQICSIRFQKIAIFEDVSEGSLFLELDCSNSLGTDLSWINLYISNANKICPTIQVPASYTSIIMCTHIKYLLLVCLPYSEKLKRGLWDLSICACLSFCVFSQIFVRNFIRSPFCLSVPHSFVHYEVTLLSVCVCVCVSLPIVARQWAACLSPLILLFSTWSMLYKVK